MRIEIAEHGRMTESGSSLLRLIQNQDIPLLDLLVRESIQNSLDAASNTSTKVSVDIQVGEFKAKDLNKHFEKIEDGLNRRYIKTEPKFIAVRDSGTSGLTGPVRYEDVKNNFFGNLLKLVYEICKPQSNEGAGGSWGLGKTIYFRLGVGLVIYYSRICEKGKYQSRLAACLVENETQKDALIPHSGGVKRGIAWWGKKESPFQKTTIPEDNEQEIQRILNVFGIPSYGVKETGTTIIIPYIDEEALLSEVYAKNEPIAEKPYWTNRVEDYLRVAVQKWYAPRLNNVDYPYGAYLSASINRQKIKVSEMLPLFRCVREFYIKALGKTLDDDSLIKEEGVAEGEQLYEESIDLRGVLNTTSSGKFVYARLSRKQLQMEPPLNNKSPYQQITNMPVQMEGGNGPIIMYTRRPGMIVGYDYDSTWTHRMPKSGPDDYIIGLFVANSVNTLKNITDQRTGKPMTLEEYIRQGEKADHASWSDRNISGNNPRIISNIQKNVINKVKKRFSEPVKEIYERQNIGLSHALANMLLPASDFGSVATLPPAPPGGEKAPGHRGGRKSSLAVTGGPYYSNGKIKLDFEIVLKGKKCQLQLQVLTDFKRYHADIWESSDELGKAFPVEFVEFNVNKIGTSAKGKPVLRDILLNLSPGSPDGHTEELDVHYIRSERFASYSYIELKPLATECILHGTLSFEFKDSSLKAVCELKEL